MRHHKRRARAPPPKATSGLRTSSLYTASGQTSTRRDAKLRASHGTKCMASRWFGMLIYGSKIRCGGLYRSPIKVWSGCVGSCDLRVDYRASVAVQALQVAGPQDPFPSWYAALSNLWLQLKLSWYGATVKGFYVSLTSEPPNPKIKDWNVTELKV